MTITGVYTGYGAPFPVNPVASTILYIAAQSFVSLGSVGPYLVSGFQCYNPNASVAYLIVGPVIVGIAASSTFDYQGPAFLGDGGTTTMGAFTTPAHTSAVSTAVPCTFELSGGPLYPLSPPTLY
jgi:hypothetical protein